VFYGSKYKQGKRKILDGSLSSNIRFSGGSPGRRYRAVMGTLRLQAN